MRISLVYIVQLYKYIIKHSEKKHKIQYFLNFILLIDFRKPYISH